MWQLWEPFHSALTSDATCAVVGCPASWNVTYLSKNAAQWALFRNCSKLYRLLRHNSFSEMPALNQPASVENWIILFTSVVGTSLCFSAC